MKGIDSRSSCGMIKFVSIPRGDVMQRLSPLRAAPSDSLAAALASAPNAVALMQVILDEAARFGVRHLIACKFTRGDDGVVTLKPLAENSPLNFSIAHLISAEDFVPMMLDIYGFGAPFDSRTVPDSPYRPAFDATWDEYSNATGCREFWAVPVCDAGLLRGYVSYVFEGKYPPDAPRALTSLSYAVYDRMVALGLIESIDRPLTTRQCEALRLCADGKRDAEIAERLGISTATAHEHIEQAKRRLNVRTRVQAAVIAARNGWI